MKNKGFTLIELLGIIVILSLISVISFVTVSNITKDKQQKEYQKFLENIYLATESYLVDNPVSDTETTIKISKLVEAGYIKEKLKNPKTKQYIKEDDEVIVTCNKDSNNNVDCSYNFVVR